MDSAATRNVALLSIYPEFADQIFAGSKTIELRRIQLPDELEHVVVYATSPVMKIVGYFDVAEIVRDTPANIWKQYRAVAGIDRKRFFSYYESRNMAVGIKIGRIHPLPIPRKLSFLAKKLTPPQSIQYLPQSYVAKLQACIAQKRASPLIGA